jgi:hypothetical protein
LYRYSLAELNDLLSNRKTNPEGDIKMNGRKVGLSELAKEWLTKAQIELKQTPTLAAVKELLTEVEQFLWAGHEMDPVCSFSSADGYVVSLVHHYNDGIGY